MDTLTLLRHVLNFVAPAFAMALLLPTVARFWQKKRGFRHNWRTQFAIVFVASAATLLAGLVIFGRDGKMASYCALVLVAATVQWVLGRDWR